jgi:hypothetical protein
MQVSALAGTGWKADWLAGLRGWPRCWSTKLTLGEGRSRQAGPLS